MNAGGLPETEATSSTAAAVKTTSPPTSQVVRNPVERKKTAGGIGEHLPTAGCCSAARVVGYFRPVAKTVWKCGATFSRETTVTWMPSNPAASSH